MSLPYKSENSFASSASRKNFIVGGRQILLLKVVAHCEVLSTIHTSHRGMLILLNTFIFQTTTPCRILARKSHPTPTSAISCSMWHLLTVRERCLSLKISHLQKFPLPEQNSHIIFPFRYKCNDNVGPYAQLDIVLRMLRFPTIKF